MPIIINVDDSNNITTNKKEVATRCLIDRYDYYGVWGIKGIIPEDLIDAIAYKNNYVKEKHLVW